MVLLVLVAALAPCASANCDRQAPFPDSSCVDTYGEIVWPTPPSTTNATQSARTLIPILTGESAFFRVRNPGGARNRWMYRFDVASSVTSAFQYATLSMSCNDTCTHPQPTGRLLTPAYRIYDKDANLVIGTFATATLLKSPRPNYAVDSVSGWPYEANGPYDNCICTGTRYGGSVDPSLVANQTFWLRLGRSSPEPQFGASVSTDAWATATVYDICFGHGNETANPVDSGVVDTGCKCDEDWFGNKCTTKNAAAANAPCCSNELTSLLPRLSVVPTPPLDSLSVMRSLPTTERMFSFASEYPAADGISYQLRIRLRTLTERCLTNYVTWPRAILSALCDVERQELCAAYMTDTINFLGRDHLVAVDYYDWPAMNAGEWVPFGTAFTADKTRNTGNCGCASTNTEKKILVRMEMRYPECEYDLQMEDIPSCINGGIWVKGQGCKCPAGFGGMRCENACTPPLGGPHCNATEYTLANGVPVTFTSFVGNKTWFTFSAPAPQNNNPHLLRITVSGDDDAVNPSTIRIAGVASCNDTMCPIGAPVSASFPWDMWLQSSSMWPHDFGLSTYPPTYSDPGPPVAYADFITLTRANTVSGFSAAKTRGRCGCATLDRASGTYLEKWRLSLFHTQGLLPSNELTITVESIDVCNGHGTWNAATGSCTCEAEYPRGGSSNACKGDFAYVLPCCQACVNGTTPVTGLRCSDVPVETTGSLSMPVTRANGSQVPGVLPPMAVSAFPLERAVFRYADLPANPKGNPWMVSFRAQYIASNGGVYGYASYIGGVHYCGTDPACRGIVPTSRAVGTAGVDFNRYYSDPAAQPVTTPLSFGGLAAVNKAASSPDVLPVLMQHNPIAYYIQAEYPYQAQRIGNQSNVFPPQCLCAPDAYAAADPMEQIVLATSPMAVDFPSGYQQPWGANRVTITANFSDPCAGHGQWDPAAGGCVCDDDYYGGACSTHTYMVTPWSTEYNYLGSGFGANRPQPPVAPCCVARWVTMPVPIPNEVNVPAPLLPKYCLSLNIYGSCVFGLRETQPFVGGETTVTLQPASIFWSDFKLTIENTRWSAAYAGLRDYAGSDNTHSAVVVYKIDQTNITTGQNYRLRVVPVADAICQPASVVRSPLRVCGDWTVARCLRSVLTSSTKPGTEGYDNNDANPRYTVTDMYAYQTTNMCGCNGTATEHSIVLLMQYSMPAPANNPSNRNCTVKVEAHAAYSNCIKGKSYWDATIPAPSQWSTPGACVCYPPFTNPPECLTDPRGVRMSMANATAPTSGSIAGALPDLKGSLAVDRGKAATFAIPFPHPSQGSLNLRMSLNPNLPCNFASGKLKLAMFRCVMPLNVSSPSYSPYSQEQTAQAIYLLDDKTLQSWSSVATIFGTAIPANHPLHWCDYTQIDAVANRSLTNSPRGSNTVTYPTESYFYQQGNPVAGYYNEQATLVMGKNSPCRGLSSSQLCTGSSEFWLMEWANIRYTISGTIDTAVANNDKCTLNAAQVNSIECGSNFLKCGNVVPQSSGAASCVASEDGTASCGACRSGFDGAGCHGDLPSYSELNNGETGTFTSEVGERIRFSLQVSPSNSRIAFKMVFTPPNLSADCAILGCNGDNFEPWVWVRARLGRAPPSLVTRTATDQTKRLFYISSTGADEENNSTLSGDDDIDPSTGLPTGETPGGGTPDSDSSSSTGGIDYFSSSSSSSSTGAGRRLLADDDDDELPYDETRLAFEQQRPVYRQNIKLNSSSSSTVEVTIEFPDDSTVNNELFRIRTHAFLFIDVQHGFRMSGHTSEAISTMSGNKQFNLDESPFAGLASERTRTTFTTEVSISDPLGTLVGRLALAILGAFAAVVIFYIIYLRCRYGSVSRGMEISLLSKAKVTKSVAPILTPEEAAAAAAAAERRRLEDEEAEKEGICTRTVKIAGLLFACVALLAFELVKVLFNISILHTSVGNFLPMSELNQLQDAVSKALKDIGIERFGVLWRDFTRLFEWLGVFNEFSLKWNCGGALSMFSPVAILLGATVLIVILQKDYFLRFALSLRGSKAGSSTAVRKIRGAVAALISTALLYILQTAIIILAQVVASTWNIKRSCSAEDKVLVDVGRYLCIVFIVLLFYVAVLLFAGIKEINSHTMIAGWFSGLWALLQLTFGIWTRDTVARFDIVERAHSFDLDENKEINPEEAVMELQGGSRGLMWTAFPIGIVLTKLTEYVNAPPMLLGTNLGVNITTPAWNRGLKWGVGMAKFATLLYSVWSADPRAVLVSFALTAVGVVLNILLPSDYHRKQWQKTHPKQEVQLAELANIHAHDANGFFATNAIGSPSGVADASWQPHGAGGTFTAYGSG